jgi:glycerate 2-kinase
LRIFRAAVAAVDPATLVSTTLAAHSLPAKLPRFVVVGAGKAAARMATGCEAALGAGRVRGLVIVPDGCAVPLESIEVRLASHPVPDARGAAATEELCRLAGGGDEPAISLISGGASSLLVRPRPPVTLAEKMEANRLLLASGAEISEFNTVRKHLSAVKGGGLLRVIRGRPILTLALSDVVGDDPSIIGSGPSTPDPSTFADAYLILERYGLTERVAPAVRELLRRGARGEVAETVKPADPEAAGVESIVVGSNRLALTAAAAEARRLGYEPLLEPTPVVGDTSDAAHRWLQRVRNRVEGRRRCAIVGGETTVALRGRGRGGRNQEFALALAKPLDGAALALLSAGTDGIDGPTDAAGAFVDGRTFERALAVGLDVGAALTDNDSYGFFDRLGDLLRCGPTGTNVMDIKLALGLTFSA